MLRDCTLVGLVSFTREFATHRRFLPSLPKLAGKPNQRTKISGSCCPLSPPASAWSPVATVAWMSLSVARSCLRRVRNSNRLACSRSRSAPRACAAPDLVALSRHSRLLLTAGRRRCVCVRAYPPSSAGVALMVLHRCNYRVHPRICDRGRRMPPLPPPTLPVAAAASEVVSVSAMVVCAPSPPAVHLFHKAGDPSWGSAGRWSRRIRISSRLLGRRCLLPHLYRRRARASEVKWCWRPPESWVPWRRAGA